MSQACARLVGVMSIPQKLQIATFAASKKICKLHDDYNFAVLHNAIMVEAADQRSGNLLKAWREFRRMTQAELAEKVKTTASVISLLEAGERKLSPKWLYRLAPALETTPGYLLDVHPDDISREIMDTWAAIPSEKRDQVREILQTFRARAGNGD